MTDDKRFTIEILDENNWLIEDNETGLDYNPIDGTTRVLKGLVDLVNNLYKENEQLKKQIDNMAFILRQNGLGLMEDDD